MYLAEILATALALQAAATLPKTCYHPPPRLLQSHLLSEDTKCLATLRMHRSLQCIIAVDPCIPQPHRTVPMSHHAIPHTQTWEDLVHTWGSILQCPHHLQANMISPQCQTGTETETQVGVMGQEVLVPEGHPTNTSWKQTLLQNTTPITLTTIQNAGRTGGTGGTVWALGQVTTATKDTAITTILTTTTTAAVADGVAMTGTETEIETESGIGIEIETMTSPTALTLDTIPTLIALLLTACLLHPHLTLLTRHPKRPRLKGWRIPADKEPAVLQRGPLCPPVVLRKTITVVTTVLCLHLHHHHRPSHQLLSLLLL